MICIKTSQRYAGWRTCALQLLSLDEPVEDSKGFVYEKEAVVDFISRPAFNGKAPISGRIAARDMSIIFESPAT